MILTKTPLRISFVGGGSDVPWFFSEEPGAVVSAAIDKYVYVTVNEKYDGSIRAAYSITENVQVVDDLQHELIREALIATGVRSVEIHSIADIPGGTGLGSSSAFTVGLMAALTPHASPYGLAESACNIELGCCRKPIGKQDQYAAAFGGVNLLGFAADAVTVAPIACDLAALSAHCLLLDTGLRRIDGTEAGHILKLQHQSREDVRSLAAMAPQFAGQLSRGDLEGCGFVMNYAWMVKSKFIRDPRVLSWYDKALAAGAWGGKLCGAGGGGFLLFLAPPDQHAAITAALGLRHVPIRVGVPGCEVVYAG